jgi:hypothetical protein
MIGDFPSVHHADFLSFDDSKSAFDTTLPPLLEVVPPPLPPPLPISSHGSSLPVTNQPLSAPSATPPAASAHTPAVRFAAAGGATPMSAAPLQQPSAQAARASLPPLQQALQQQLAVSLEDGEKPRKRARSSSKKILADLAKGDQTEEERREMKRQLR